MVCKFLIEAVQDRIGNNNNTDDKIDAFLYDNAICDGLTKEVIDDKVKYKIDITKKI